MGDSMRALMRSGAISGKQAAKHDLPKVLRMTKVERDKEEEFHGRQGLRDQGGLRDRGHEVSKVDHIDRHQELSKPKHDGLGAPSKMRRGVDSGGAVNAYGQPGVDEIGERRLQKPDFPRGSPGGERASRGGREDTGGYSGDRMPNRSGSLKIDRRDKPTTKDWTNKRAKAKIAKSGPIYGGGSRFEQ
jgi:hypothetical protein